MAGQARPGLQLCPSPALLSSALPCSRDRLSAGREYLAPQGRGQQRDISLAGSWQPGHAPPPALHPWQRCPAPPRSPLLLRPADAGPDQTAKTNGRVPVCSAVHRAKARAGPATHPPLFWQPWWVSARVGNFGPCLSPVVGPGAPDRLWLSAAFIDSYSGLGAGSEYCSHKEHTFLWVYPSDFTMSSMTGIVIPDSLVW